MISIMNHTWLFSKALGLFDKVNTKEYGEYKRKVNKIMGWNLYSIYAYAVNVKNLPLRDKIKALLNDDDEEKRYQDVEDVLEDFWNGCLDDHVYEKLKNTRWENIYGPDGLYIGYPANMPYEQPLMTKEEMDKEIY